MTSEAKILLSVAFITLLLLGGAIFFLGKSSPSSEPSPKADSKILLKEDSFKIATDSAKVTIVEFSDFQCPACKSVQPTLGQILKDYQGKVNFYYRHFPLPQHKNAVPAALAAEAAGEQGKFWEMANIIFTQQENWESKSSPQDLFSAYSKELNLNEEQFKKDLENNKFTQKIERDKNDAVSLGVNSTPTFYINGEKMAGALSYNEFKLIIDKEIGK